MNGTLRWFLVLPLFVSTVHGAGFSEANFTQVINDVTVTPPGAAVRQAAVQGSFKARDVLKTGQQSRAEFKFPDDTLTRVGANAVFSFEPEGRKMNLQSGTVLFHSPEGKGGGTIQTAGATAGVIGTTIIVSATSNGGFKIIVLEGKGKVKLPNGKVRILTAGQLIFILPGSQDFGPTLTVELAMMVRSSALVNGFSSPLASLPQVKSAIAKQEKQIARGTFKQTGLLAGDAMVNTVQIVDGNNLRVLFEQEDYQTVSRFFASDVLLSGGALPSDHIFSPDELVALTTGTAFESAGLADDAFSSSAFSTGQHDFLAARNIFIQQESGGPYIMVPSNILAFVAAEDIVIRENSSGFGLAHFQTQGDLALIFQGHLRSESPSGFSFVVDGPQGNVFSFITASDLVLAPPGSGGFDNPNGRLEFFTLGQADMQNLFFFADELQVGALETASLSNISFSGNPSFIGIDARTVVLENINFPLGSEVSLHSENGMLAPNPNTGAPVQSGYVNFVNGVLYNGNPAELAIGNGIEIGTFGSN